MDKPLMDKSMMDNNNSSKPHLDMDVVQRFNAELSSLYEARLPISKAKMSQITRISMSGVKMYKHIVQSVERFIHKCRPEYKLPALYVIDSIVRQSKHQFGTSEVYALRFTRNFKTTFQNLLLTCLAEDKPKIVRVLNLWQRNVVFKPDVIQPLLDLANPKTQLDQMRFQPPPESSPPPPDRLGHQSKGSGIAGFNPIAMINSAAAAASAVTSLANNLTKVNNKKDNSTLVGQLQQLANSLNMLKNEEAQLKQVKENQKDLSNFGTDVDYRNSSGELSTSGELMYDDEDDNRSNTPTEAEPVYTKPSSNLNHANNANGQTSESIHSIANLMQNIFTNTDFLSQINSLDSNTSADVLHNVTQLSQLGETMQPLLNQHATAALDQLAPGQFQGSVAQSATSNHHHHHHNNTDLISSSHNTVQSSQQPVPVPLANQFNHHQFTNSTSGNVSFQAQLEMFKHGNNVTNSVSGLNNVPSVNDELPFAMFQSQATAESQSNDFALPSENSSEPQQVMAPEDFYNNNSSRSKGPSGQSSTSNDRRSNRNPSRSNREDGSRDHVDHRDIRKSDRNEPRNDQRNDRSDRTDRNDRDRRNNANTNNRDSNRQPNARSNNNNRRSRSRSRSRSKSLSPRERQERDKDRERKKKGLPSFRKNYLTISSTTLWIGHVPKFASESDLGEVFGDYGIDVPTIDMIPSRGCAYVCLHCRADAFKALNRLKTNPKILGTTVKFAWAPGKGVKGNVYKDYWESDLGCAFIPHSILNDKVNFLVLEEGGVIEDETLPVHLKEVRQQQKQRKLDEEEAAAAQSTQSRIDVPVISQPVPVPVQNESVHLQVNHPVPNKRSRFGPALNLGGPMARGPNHSSLPTMPMPSDPTGQPSPHGLVMPGVTFPFNGPPPSVLLMPPHGPGNAVLAPSQLPLSLLDKWNKINNSKDNNEPIESFEAAMVNGGGNSPGPGSYMSHPSSLLPTPQQQQHHLHHHPSNNQQQPHLPVILPSQSFFSRNDQMNELPQHNPLSPPKLFDAIAKSNEQMDESDRSNQEDRHQYRNNNKRNRNNNYNNQNQNHNNGNSNNFRKNGNMHFNKNNSGGPPDHKNVNHQLKHLPHNKQQQQGANAPDMPPPPPPQPHQMDMMPPPPPHGSLPDEQFLQYNHDDAFAPSLYELQMRQQQAGPGGPFDGPPPFEPPPFDGSMPPNGPPPGMPFGMPLQPHPFDMHFNRAPLLHHGPPGPFMPNGNQMHRPMFGPGGPQPGGPRGHWGQGGRGGRNNNFRNNNRNNGNNRNGNRNSRWQQQQHGEQGKFNSEFNSHNNHNHNNRFGPNQLYDQAEHDSEHEMMMMMEDYCDSNDNANHNQNCDSEPSPQSRLAQNDRKPQQPTGDNQKSAGVDVPLTTTIEAAAAVPATATAEAS